MTAEPKPESFEEEYEEYDEFDEEENERGLSGLVVLLMGVVMLGAFASVVWIAYQQGIKTAGATSSPPTIAANPDPVKIENATPTASELGNERSVYDRVEGAPQPAEVLAAGPEEPLPRGAQNPSAGAPSAVVEDAVADRIASLAAADAALEAAAGATPAAGPAATPPTPARAEPAQTRPAVTPKPEPVAPSAAAGRAPAPTATGDALSGTHVVQVGAFKSEGEAQSNWTKLQGRLGDFATGKSPDIERADLGDKGVFYRLRIGPFTSSADAKTYCDGLKSRGADCIVKAK
jgi:cell division protein FtsN